LRGTIESGDFKIDLDRRTVTLCGLELWLTSEEFDVLVFLAGHPQSLVTPRTMVATSWTANRLQQTEFLKVLISSAKSLMLQDLASTTFGLNRGLSTASSRLLRRQHKVYGLRRKRRIFTSCPLAGCGKTYDSYQGIALAMPQIACYQRAFRR